MSQKISPAPSQTDGFLKRYGLVIGLVILFLICLLPPQPGLPVAGQRMIGLLVFSVIVWMTESVSYPVSASIIVSLMAFMLGFSLDPSKPNSVFGTSAALTIALDGFRNTAFALVAAALFISAAMMHTGLDKRIALVVLSKIGAKTNRILLGVIIVGFVLSFFVPSTTARVACLVPIVTGIIVAFGVDKKSRFAAVLMIATAQADSVWNVGIKTAAAQNMVAVGFIQKMLRTTITWPQWFIAAAPFACIMSVILYFVLLKLIPPEVKEIEGGEETIRRELAKLGPVTTNEKKLIIISLLLLFFWSTENIIHPFDTSSTAIVAITIMLMPYIGVMTWKDAQPKIPWGTVMLFGVGISLGTALLTTKGAAWLATVITGVFGLSTMPPLGIIAVLAAFLIVIHLGFASATALASATIPIVIATLQSVSTPVNIVGMTMILQYVVSFGFILPVNAPQNMVAYSTDTFEVKDFIRTGIPLTFIAYGLIILFSATYWKFLGLIP
jgi:anion transporter